MKGEQKKRSEPSTGYSSASLRQEAKILEQAVQISARALEIAEASGLSRREIAKRMGMTSPSTVQRLIHDAESGNPRIQTLIRFATACGVDMSVQFTSVKVNAFHQNVLEWPTSSSEASHFTAKSASHQHGSPELCDDFTDNVLQFPHAGEPKVSWRSGQNAKLGNSAA